MAVTETLASLIISGRHDRATAEAVTAALGLEPSRSHEAGAPHRSPTLAASGRVYDHSNWIFTEARSHRTDEDFHGMRSLDALAERLEPRADTIRALGKDYWIVVDLFARSDSTQAGFYVGEETMRRLGRLGAAFMPSVYCSDDEDA